MSKYGSLKKISIFFVMSSVLLLAGCASNKPSQEQASVVNPNASGGRSFTERGEHGSTSGITDPAVKALVKDGVFNATPEKIEQLLSKRTFYFGFDSNVINKDDYIALQAHAALMKTPEYHNIEIVLEGNTDQRGTRIYNLGLGMRRAKAVRDYLESQGVASSQIRLISYGFEKPIDVHNNPIAWAKNRRVHLVFQNKKEDHFADKNGEVQHLR